MPVSAPYAAHTMSQIHAIDAARPLHGAMVNGEDHRVTLFERHHFGTGLHSRTLLRDHEFAAGEIFAGSREQDGHLKRKNMLAVKILMQAVVVARSVLQKQGCRSILPCLA